MSIWDWKWNGLVVESSRLCPNLPSSAAPGQRAPRLRSSADIAMSLWAAGAGRIVRCCLTRSNQVLCPSRKPRAILIISLRRQGQHFRCDQSRERWAGIRNNNLNLLRLAAPLHTSRPYSPNEPPKQPRIHKQRSFFVQYLHIHTPSQLQHASRDLFCTGFCVS